MTRAMDIWQGEVWGYVVETVDMWSVGACGKGWGHVIDAWDMWQSVGARGRVWGHVAGVDVCGKYVKCQKVKNVDYD